MFPPPSTAVPPCAELPLALTTVNASTSGSESLVSSKDNGTDSATFRSVVMVSGPATGGRLKPTGTSTTMTWMPAPGSRIIAVTWPGCVGTKPSPLASASPMIASVVGVLEP